MPIKKQEYYEGAALHILVRGGNVRQLDYMDPLFVANGRIRLLLKYSTRGRTPWGFTVTTREQRVLRDQDATTTIIGLICGYDGIAAIHLHEYLLIAPPQESAIHIACARKHREHYEVSGPAGTLARKIREHSLFRLLCRGLRRRGYKLSFDVKDAASYGVPQRRRRLILVANKSKVIALPPESGEKPTVRTTIGHLPRPGDGFDALHDLPEKVRSERVQGLIRDIPRDGGSRRDLPSDRQLPCHTKSDGFSDVYGRMAWDQVAPTITSGCFNPSKGRFLHPDQDRAITMREAALLQSFPADYRFPVARGKQAIALMIGNALPPEFIRIHATAIASALAVSS